MATTDESILIRKYRPSPLASFIFANLESTLFFLTIVLTIQKKLSCLNSSTSTSRNDHVHQDGMQNDVEVEINLGFFVVWTVVCVSLASLLSTIMLRCTSRSNDRVDPKSKSDCDDGRSSSGCSIGKEIRGIYNIHEMKSDEIGISMGSLLPTLILLSLLPTMPMTGRRSKDYFSSTPDHLFGYLTLFICVSGSLVLEYLVLIFNSRVWNMTIGKRTMISTRHVQVLYIIFMSIHMNIVSTDPLPMIQTGVFSIVVMTLIGSYEKQSNGLRRNHKMVVNEITALQRVFTIGEWITLSCFIALLITEYILKHIIPMLLHNEYWIPTLVPPYITVSHAGIVGCLIGCIMPISWTSMKAQQIFLSIRKNQLKLFCQEQNGLLKKKFEKVISSQSNNGDFMMMMMIPCLFRVLSVVGFVLIAINIALYQQCTIDMSNDSASWCKLIQDQKIHDGIVGKHQLLSRIPTAILWLIDFLSSPEGINESSNLTLSTIPRYGWLIYWIVVLLITIPFAIVIAMYLSHNIEDLTRKKKMIVVARKYFHFVAVLLFAPPTYYAPSMMFLSYAIASALLIFIESLRYIYLQQEQCTLKQKEIETDEKFTNNKPQSTGESENSNLSHRATTLTINDFFQTFFDEKDLGAKDGGFVVTHVALVVGCAIPLWFHHIYCVINSNNDSFHQNVSIMPYIGILSLGIGDAAGAIYGSLFGKTSWPESRRTVEGSLAMLVSMEIVMLMIQRSLGNVDVLCFGSLLRDLLLLFPIVILEAITFQIDNICLPLFSVGFYSTMHV